MMIPAMSVLCAYVLFLIYEKHMNDKRLSSFKYVVHVNGIRGKTEVCRLLDAVFREAGYKVFTKTTGTNAAYIDVSGSEHGIKRRGPSNIGEQLRMIRLAERQGAEVLILECMAVNPELQRVSQELIVKGRLNVITNVRHDHIFEMGESRDEIAESLSNTVPREGVLFTSDRDYYDFFKEKCEIQGSEAVLCVPEDEKISENEAIALRMAAYAGIDLAIAERGLSKVHRDFGTRKLYGLPSGAAFINLFSANDPQSTAANLKPYLGDRSKLIFLYNHRADRPDRLLLFERYFFPDFDYKKILVTGQNKGFACRSLKKAGCHDVTLGKAKDIFGEEYDKDTLIAGIGNIKGEAYSLITDLEGRGQEIS